jgi:hypothetical protein
MELTELTYSCGRTIQKKQYEPINFHFSAKCELAEGEDQAAAYTELKRIVNIQINAAVEQVVKSKEDSAILEF